MNFDSSVLQVAIEDIIPNRFQPRLAFESASLNELANSIKQHGIIQPLVLRKLGDKYEIIAGERRYRAATMAGLSAVPAVISKIDDKTSAEVAIAENVQRRELTAIEEAKSYKALLDQGYMSQEELAKRMGLSTNAIASKLKLLTLASEVQNAILENKISERHARALLIIPDHESQVKWLNRIINERLNVRTLDEELKKEYKESAMNTGINIEQIKQNATDIPFIAPAQPTTPVENNPFSMGPIDLGQKQTNKFFNNLEDQAVNMQMTEAINPFLQQLNPNEPPKTTNDGFSVASINNSNDEIYQATSDISPIETNKEEPSNIFPSTPIPVTNISNAEVDEIDSLDSLDFTPPNSTIDVNVAKDKINNLLEELKNENYPIDFVKAELAGQVIYTITIKNTES